MGSSADGAIYNERLPHWQALLVCNSRTSEQVSGILWNIALISPLGRLKRSTKCPRHCLATKARDCLPVELSSHHPGRRSVAIYSEQLLAPRASLLHAAIGFMVSQISLMSALKPRVLYSIILDMLPRLHRYKVSPSVSTWPSPKSMNITTQPYTATPMMRPIPYANTLIA